jgi:hypothetical protein
MSCIEEIKDKFTQYDNALKTCFPKVDPKLITGILRVMKEGNEPMFTMEVFLNTNAHIDELRDWIAKKTGEVATFYDDGYHMVSAHKITLEMVHELSQHDDVDEIRGTYIQKGTASIGPTLERTQDDEYWEGQKE